MARIENEKFLLRAPRAARWGGPPQIATDPSGSPLERPAARVLAGFMP
jgi:hypothetical protein